MAAVRVWRWLIGLGIIFTVLFLVNILARNLGNDYRMYIFLVQTFIIFQVVLFIGSRYLWRAVNSVICDNATLHVNKDATPTPSMTVSFEQPQKHDLTSYKDHVIPTKSSLWVNIMRAMLLVFLICTHASFLTVIFFVKINPTPVAMLLYTCLGLYAQVIMALYFFNFIRWLTGKIIKAVYKKTMHLISRKLTLLLALTYGLSIAMIGLYTAAQPPRVKYTDINLPKLPKSMEGYKIVQISDIHLGPTVGRDKLLQITNIVNSLQPDSIVLVGDLVDSTVKKLQGAAEVLGDMKAEDGKFFVTGNHEYISRDVDGWLTYLKQQGFTVLHNENVKIFSRKNKQDYICMAGVDDLQAQYSRVEGHGMDLDKAVRECDKDHPVILLAHQPYAAKYAVQSKHDIQLILTGHTHGGQMFPFSIMIYLSNPYFLGLYYEGSTLIHVGQGTQYWGIPMRIGTNNEINVLILKSL